MRGHARRPDACERGGVTSVSGSVRRRAKQAPRTGRLLCDAAAACDRNGGLVGLAEQLRKGHAGYRRFAEVLALRSGIVDASGAMELAETMRGRSRTPASFVGALQL